MSKTLTYAELKEVHDKKWREIASEREHLFTERNKELADMPHVKACPEIGSTWNNSEIICHRCNKTEYVVNRFVLMNGKNHRAELKCAGCGFEAVWDFGSKKWMINHA